MKNWIYQIGSLAVLMSVSAYSGYWYGTQYQPNLNANVPPLIEDNKESPLVFKDYISIDDVVFSADSAHRSRTILVSLAIEVTSKQAKTQIIAMAPQIKSDILHHFVNFKKQKNATADQIMSEFKQKLDSAILPPLQGAVGEDQVRQILITKLLVE